MFVDEKVGKRINIERTEELVATGAETIAVACPFCMTMMTDGITALGSTVTVQDISEVVASQLRPNLLNDTATATATATAFIAEQHSR